MLFVLSGFTPVHADEIDALFLRGNEHYQNGDFAQARDAYLKILESGYESWEVYYNIGNTYFKEREIGKAILFYERAKRLEPQNEDVLFNLALVNLSTVDRIQELPTFFLTNWLRKLANLFSMGLLATVVAISYVCVMVLLMLRTLTRRAKFYRVLVVSMIGVSFVLAISAGLFLFRVVEKETRVEAIVLTDKVFVRSAPDELSTEVFTLHEGVKVLVQDESSEWAKIRLADGKVGWLRRDIIEII